MTPHAESGAASAAPIGAPKAAPATPGRARPGTETYVADESWVIEPMTLRRTLWLLRSDYQRMADHYRFPLTKFRAVKMTMVPSIMGLIIYRFSHLFYTRGFTSLAWMLYALNNTLTGFDVVPTTKIGERCFLGHTISTILSGQIGRNVTMYARVGVGGGRDGRDIGAGPGLPIVGDGVVLGVNSTVMGSIRVGDGVYLGAHSLLLHDAPPSSILMGTPAKITSARAPDAPVGFVSSILEESP